MNNNEILEYINAKENCKVNDIFLIRPGKDDKLITYTELGKVIIPVNKINKGYAKVTEIVKIAEKYILVKMENVIKDYYDKIPYEEFKKVLKINGFKIGFDRPFETQYEYGIEHQILAYNLNNGIIIVAETFYGSKTFNSIEVYCPNVNGLGLRNPLMSSGSYNMTKLNLCRGTNFEFPLQKINKMVKDKIWNSDNDIQLWTYADTDNYTEYTSSYKYGFKAYALWEDTIDRILLADKDLESILGNCTRLIPVFKTRK